MADWVGGGAREDVELEARECNEEVLEALATGSEPKDAGALADLATGAVCSSSNISVIAMLAAASTDDAEDKARTASSRLHQPVAPRYRASAHLSISRML
jgi:hypothetical protein